MRPDPFCFDRGEGAEFVRLVCNRGRPLHYGKTGNPDNIAAEMCALFLSRVAFAQHFFFSSKKYLFFYFFFGIVSPQRVCA